MKIACIFDWDGTIVDSGHTHEATWIALASSRNLPLIDDFFSITFGKRNVEIIMDILKWTADPKTAQEMSDEKETLYRKIVRERGVPPVAGAEAFLKALNSAGIPCAVGSSTPRENLDTTVEKLGYGGYFKAYAASEDVSRGKPAPDVFLCAAKKLGVAPENCVVFEDSLVGIEAGVAAGMKTVALTLTNPREFWIAHNSIPADRTDMVIDDYLKLSPADVVRLFD